MNDAQVRPLFGLLEFSDEVVEGSEEYLKIKELFGRAGSLDDVINGWMDREKQTGISFGSGTSDFEDSVGKPAVFVVLKIKNEAMAGAQCTKEKLVITLGRELCVDDAGRVFDDEEFDSDQKWMAHRDAVLRIKYNEFYHEDHIPRANVQRFIMSYLGASKCTSVELFFPDENFLLDREIDDEKLEEVFDQIKTYTCMSASVYESEEMDCAISEDVSFFL